MKPELDQDLSGGETTVEKWTNPDLTTLQTSRSQRRWRRLLVGVLVLWQCLLTSLLTLAGLEDPKVFAMACMMWGLNLLWIGLGGIASLITAAPVRHWGKATRHRYFWFVGGCTVLALVEEAVTTAMTNAAPWFGVALGEVFITASADYLDVVLYHSVVVIVPQFLAWGWILSRWHISAFGAMIVYGLTGFFNEALFSGPNPFALAQWILVYGLMVFLPAQLYAHKPGRRPVRWWMFPLLVLLPILASLPMVALLLNVIAPGHPSIHFAQN